MIDGDGAVFDLDLIAKGIPGGRDAGLQLEKGVTEYLHTQEGHQLWAYVFLDKHGVTKALRYSPKPEAAGTLSDFMVGFSQASQRFMVVDVGGEKEAADAKITGSVTLHFKESEYILTTLVALIEAEICLPQTVKIVFAGAKTA